MIYHEIVHTCSNAHVADAALLSIGGPVALAVADGANRRAMSRGDYAAMLVRDYAAHADDDAARLVAEAAHGSQHPVLSGLRFILEKGSSTAWMSGPRV